MKKQLLYLAAAATAFMIFKLITRQYDGSDRLDEITPQQNSHGHHLTDVFSKAKAVSQSS
jgi:hypothetical protein